MKTQLSRPTRRKASYTDQYKQEALKLWRNSGRSAAKVGAELGIRPALLSKTPTAPRNHTAGWTWGHCSAVMRQGRRSALSRLGFAPRRLRLDLSRSKTIRHVLPRHVPYRWEAPPRKS